MKTPDGIKNIRDWIELCDKIGIGVPDQVNTLNVYTMLLECKLAEIERSQT